LKISTFGSAADRAISLGDVADYLEQQRRYRYAEQLRSAALSISNNFVEGSGSTSSSEFRNFLNYARRSAFECANMLLIFQRKQMPEDARTQALLIELNEICRMITSLSHLLE
jgi:four helix bundle protein